MEKKQAMCNDLFLMTQTRPVHHQTHMIDVNEYLVGPITLLAKIRKGDKKVFLNVIGGQNKSQV